VTCAPPIAGAKNAQQQEMAFLRRRGRLFTVLVVDDEPGVRGSLRRQIQAGGHLVFEAASVEQALTMLRDMPVDAAVLDLRLNHESGLEVLGFIRSEPRLVDLPVLILTAFAPTTLQQQQINEYKAMVLYKPTGCRVVLDHLTRLLTQH
jgi:two-component system, OmpR family, KDP operon response regulator KdpE